MTFCRGQRGLTTTAYLEEAIRMALDANKPGFRPAQPFPVIHFDETRATNAYHAHVALLDQERRYPSLKNNPAWIVLRADAYENFALAFGGEA